MLQQSAILDFQLANDEQFDLEDKMPSLCPIEIQNELRKNFP